MMQRYQNLNHSAMAPSFGIDPSTESQLARSLLNRMQDYQRRHRAKHRVHRAMRWLFGRRYRHGVTRMVALGGGSAYKVPRFDSGLSLFLTGWLANRQEARKWYSVNHLYEHREGSGPHPRDRLVPVRRTLFWGLLLVMQRCQEVTQADGKAYIDEQAEQAKNDPDTAFDWQYWAPDLHPANLGRLNGEIRVLDYSD